jgi:hypothetical protein
MTDNYNWIISKLDCVPNANGLENVVQSIHWRLSGTDGTNYADVFGEVILNHPDPDSFILYKDISKEQIINWITASLGEGKIISYKKTIDDKIAAIVNPPVVNPEFPWAV